MWIFQQSNGRFTHDNEFICFGYSGNGEGKNNPLKEAIPNVGPIPKGDYNIGVAFDHATKGPICMRLNPLESTNVYGRSGFMIHGDSILKPGTASEGCIILPKSARFEIARSTDKLLRVI